MYINPFVAGVIATLFAEACGLIVYAISAVILERRSMEKKFAEYEKAKKDLERKGLSAQEYEKALKELAERFKV